MSASRVGLGMLRSSSRFVRSGRGLCRIEPHRSSRARVSNGHRGNFANSCTDQFMQFAPRAWGACRTSRTKLPMKSRTTSRTPADQMRPGADRPYEAPCWGPRQLKPVQGMCRLIASVRSASAQNYVCLASSLHRSPYKLDAGSCIRSASPAGALMHLIRCCLQVSQSVQQLSGA
jgi:hypothetical protein